MMQRSCLGVNLKVRKLFSISFQTVCTQSTITAIYLFKKQPLCNKKMIFVSTLIQNERSMFAFHNVFRNIPMSEHLDYNIKKRPGLANLLSCLVIINFTSNNSIIRQACQNVGTICSPLQVGQSKNVGKTG